MASSLQGKCILLGLSGSIAAYKVAEWTRALVKEEARVEVIFTEAASRFVTPLTFAALSGSEVHTDLFASGADDFMAHITLSREADAFLIAPASAQTIARLAAGMADNLLCATALAANIPILLCPAMNTAMYHHPATQENLRRLQGYGYHVLAPANGDLACGEKGDGRLPEWDVVHEALLGIFTPQDFAGRKVLITAGPTRELIDPARFLSNPSSGKMGFALARAARRRGARVTLISGPVGLTPPPGLEFISVQSAGEMADAVFAHAESQDIIVKAAAVADFTIVKPSTQKIKKTGEKLSLELKPTVDILAGLGARKKAGQLLVGFAAESRNHLAEGTRKLHEKHLDLIVVNDILSAHTGFAAKTNQVTLIDANGRHELPLLSKEETADRIWDAILRLKPVARQPDLIQG